MSTKFQIVKLPGNELKENYTNDVKELTTKTKYSLQVVWNRIENVDENL